MTGVRNLRHLAIETPDVEAVRTFATSFGLETSERGQDLVLRCSGRDQDQITVREGAHRQVHHAEFSVLPGQLGELQKRIEAAGVALIDAPPGSPEDGLWVRDPDGYLLHIVDEQPAPTRPYPDWPLNQGGRMERFDIAKWEHLPTAAMPRRLMHCLIFVSDQAASERFYFDALGLRLSDRVPGVATFMKGS